MDGCVEFIGHEGSSLMPACCKLEIKRGNDIGGVPERTAFSNACVNGIIGKTVMRFRYPVRFWEKSVIITPNSNII